MFRNLTGCHVYSGNKLLQKLLPTDKISKEVNAIEIIDNETTEGNLLLTNILLGCILPPKHGATGAGVIYFDVNQHFDLLRLISVMEERTKEEEKEIKEWMKRFYVVRCNSSEQLIITMHSIEPLIANSKIPISLLILDGLSTFYWNDQCAGGSSQYLKEDNMRKLVKVVETFRKKYNVGVLARTLEMFPPIEDEKGAGGVRTNPKNLRLYGDFWDSFVSHRFTLGLEPSDSKELYGFAVAKCVSPAEYKVKFDIFKNGLVS